MATYVGKINDSQEAAYVDRIITASGATQRQFVRAALLAYCGMLLEKATQMREEAASGQSGNAGENLAENTSADTNSNTLADTQGAVVDA